MAEIKDKVITVDGLKSLHDYNKDTYLKKSGGTVTGTTVFSKVKDSAGDYYSAPAVVIGGEPTTYHLELDNNEIQAKINETKAGNLFLNSNGGTVHVGFDGLKIDSASSIIPEYALSGSIGQADLPFKHMYVGYFNLYGAENAQYGRFRVSTIGTASDEGITTLELGNATATGTAHNASGKITMYGSGTSFTNILPSTATSGSNKVYLPTSTGTLLTDKTGIQKTLLWTNASPESSFAAQTISLNLYAYDEVEIEFNTTTSSSFFWTIQIKKGRKGHFIGWAQQGDDGQNTLMTNRQVTVLGSGVTFADNETKVIDTKACSVKNTSSIPVKIWGIKGVQ